MPHIQSQLIDVFTDSMKNDGIFCKLLQDRPCSLDDAVKIAITEQQAAKTIQIYQKREEEPMEIDSISSQMKDMS